MCRSRPQLTVANHLCCFTSLAPEFEPRRLCSSLMSSFLIADLHMLVTGVESGYMTSFLSTLANVAFRLGPLNGVVANCRQRVRSGQTPDEATHNHLVHQNTQGPPIDSDGVSASLDHLRRNVLLRPDE